MNTTTLDLGEGHQALAVFPTAADGAAGVLAALALPPHQAVLLLLGAADGLDAALVPRLTQFFGRGIARAALDSGAVVLDGGTQAGVMALMGQGAASRGQHISLVGVAPAALVAPPNPPATGTPLEPHHSHFVLVEGAQWGAETPMLFQLADALRAGPVPALALVVGGGSTTTQEVLRAVRQRIPLLVITGSGGLADVLAQAWPTRSALPDDPVMAEILAEGTLAFYPLSGSAQGLGQHIVRHLGADSALVQAWEAFADYDYNATLQQRRFDGLQQAIIWLGLAATVLALLQQLYAPRVQLAGGIVSGDTRLISADELWQRGFVGWWAVYHLLILIPITLTVLVTVASRFKQGAKWLILRGGAEAIKREIFRYRTRITAYQDEPASLLTQRVEEITRRTMRTEVNTSSLVPYDKALGFPPTTGDAEPDDCLAWMPAPRYVAVRLGNQLAYFRRKAVRLENQLRRLSWLTFAVGGVGTYMAAVGQQAWVALTTAIGVALGSYLGYRQTESTLTKYNQAATDLGNVRAWWNALPPDGQLLQANIDLLVAHTEQVLQSELDGWVQQMQNVLAGLHKPAPVAAAAEEAAPAVAPDFPAGSAAFPAAEEALATAGPAPADGSPLAAPTRDTVAATLDFPAVDGEILVAKQDALVNEQATPKADGETSEIPATTAAADLAIVPEADPTDLTADVELPDDGSEAVYTSVAAR